MLVLNTCNLILKCPYLCKEKFNKKHVIHVLIFCNINISSKVARIGGLLKENHLCFHTKEVNSEKGYDYQYEKFKNLHMPEILLIIVLQNHFFNRHFCTWNV